MLLGNDFIVAGEVSGRLHGYGFVLFDDVRRAESINQEKAASAQVSPKEVSDVYNRGNGAEWETDEDDDDTGVVTLHLTLSLANRLSMWLKGLSSCF